MPDMTIAAVFEHVRRRWRVRALAHAVAVAGAVFAAIVLLASPVMAGVVAAVVLGAMIVRSRAIDDVAAATLIEGGAGGFDNLLITAAEIEARPRPVDAEIESEIRRQAASRIAAVDASRVVPLAQPIAVALAVLGGCIALASVGGEAIKTKIDAVAGAPSRAADAPAIVVHVTPPAYTKRAAETFENPLQIAAIAGSRIVIDAAGSRLRDWIATQSEAIELRPAGEARFLSVMVAADAPPLVRVITPGKDTAFAQPQGQVAITVESRDDLGLQSLVLRYTKASGGGENVAFSEGELPVRLERSSSQQWRAQAVVSLDALGLADGDIVVYRAIARDTNPAGAPVQSEQYLIEIGKSAEIADAGFSLPSEEKKYAISQQMVIYKTEQLIAARDKHRDDWLDQNQSIGVEQRMVRAEVVFLGGGDVQDEVEEAAHSHELAEGRLENSGRAEMLSAINAMSRAEALLNDGRAEQALVFERQALASLERALDRRRYFMRTLPDRSRIDTTRRLTGERREARSWTRDEPRPVEPGSLDAARRVMRDLIAAAPAGAGADAALAARVAALDPSSQTLQAAAVAIASASSNQARIDAVKTAMAAVTAHALKTLPSSSAIDVGDAALSGALADELARRRKQ